MRREGAARRASKVESAREVAAGVNPVGIPSDAPCSSLTPPRSFFERISVKIIADFTSIIRLRNPEELGGLHFSLNMLITQAAFISAGFVWSSKKFEDCEARALGELELDLDADNATGDICAPSKLRFVPIFFASAWLINALFFLYIIKPAFLHTFFSVTSGRDATRQLFLEGETDEEKVKIFFAQRYFWEDLREDVRDWLFENWQTCAFAHEPNYYAGCSPITDPPPPLSFAPASLARRAGG